MKDGYGEANHPGDAFTERSHPIRSKHVARFSWIHPHGALIDIGAVRGLAAPGRETLMGTDHLPTIAGRLEGFQRPQVERGTSAHSRSQ
jgi:hypothetical protein